MALVKTATEITNCRIGENSYFTGRFFYKWLTQSRWEI